MFVSMIIVFREVMEAGLIVGIILAATQGVLRRGSWIAGGIATGVAGATLVALFATTLFDAFQGAGQEVFTAAILCFAVVMLAWHVGWMSHHGREMATEMRKVGDAVRLGHRSLAALAAVVAVAVMREGSEVVLFLFGIAAGSNTTPMSLAGGSAVGLALASIVSWCLYRGLVIIPMHRLFRVTNQLIALLAAGMAGQAAATLHAADVLPGWGEQLWNTSRILGDDTILGRSLHALIGYSARPSGIQVAAWLATLVVMITLSRVVGRPRRGNLARPLTAAVLLLGLLAGGGQARADDVVQLSFSQHRFVPDRLTVPANVKFRVLVKNNDDTADEFESVELNREKLVPPGQTVTVFLGPLSPGQYKFFGDFHQDTAQGVMVAK